MYVKHYLNVRNHFKQDTRTNAELKAKLFEVFEYNKKEFNKFARMYDGNNRQSVFDVIDYELGEIEKLKKECMVMKMKSKHNCMVNNPTRTSGVALHKLYNKSEINVPSVKDILIKQVSLAKYFDEFLGGLDEYEPNEDEMHENIELCNFLDIDYDGIAPYSVGKKGI